MGVKNELYERVIEPTVTRVAGTLRMTMHDRHKLYVMKILCLRNMCL